MKKFKFRLQTLLDLALKLEEQQLSRTKAAEKELELAQQRLKDLLDRRQELLCDRQTKAVQGCTVKELFELEGYIDWLAREGERQKFHVQEASERYQQEMNALLAQMRQRKMLENLRARALDEFRRQQSKEEQLVLDELALVRYWYHFVVYLCI